MIWAVALSAGALVAAGVYLALSRDVLRAVIGLSLIGSGANLVVLASGRVGTAVPAVIQAGTKELPEIAANPLPQALVLTAIVISFSLICFSLMLVLAIKQRMGTADSMHLRAAEPPPAADAKPPVLDDAA